MGRPISHTYKTRLSTARSFSTCQTYQINVHRAVYMFWMWHLTPADKLNADQRVYRWWVFFKHLPWTEFVCIHITCCNASNKSQSRVAMCLSVVPWQCRCAFRSCVGVSPLRLYRRGSRFAEAGREVRAEADSDVTWQFLQWCSQHFADIFYVFQLDILWSCWHKPIAAGECPNAVHLRFFGVYIDEVQDLLPVELLLLKLATCHGWLSMVGVERG